MSTSEHISLRDGLLALLIVTSWAFNIAIIRIGALEMPPLFLLFIRFGIGALVFMPFMKKIDRETFLNLALYALFYVIAHLGFLYIGSLYMQASLVSFILQMGMPFALLLGFIFYHERFGLKTAIGILTALCGVGIILYQPIEQFSVVGALLLLASAFCWGAGSLCMRRVESVDLATMTAVSYGLATPCIGLISYLVEDDQLSGLMSANHYWIGFILLYQIFFMSYALYLWKGLMSRNPVNQITAFSVLIPLLTVVFGYLLLGETLSIKEVIGGGVLIAGVAIIILRRIQKKTHDGTIVAEI